MKFTPRELEVIGKLSTKYLRSPGKTIKIEELEGWIPMLRSGNQRSEATVRGSAAHFMRFLCLKLAVAGIEFDRVSQVGRSNNAEYAFKGIAAAKRAAKLHGAGAKPRKHAKAKVEKLIPRGSVIKRPRKPKEIAVEQPISHAE